MQITQGPDVQALVVIGEQRFTSVLKTQYAIDKRADAIKQRIAAAKIITNMCYSLAAFMCTNEFYTLFFNLMESVVVSEPCAIFFCCLLLTFSQSIGVVML